MPSRIYLFYGDEDFLIDAAINKLKSSIADPAMNVEQIDGAEENFEKIIAGLRTQPFFSAQKLIIIKDIDLKLKIWEGLVESLKMLPPETSVVFYASAVHRGARIYKYLDEAGEVCECRPFSEWEHDQAVRWICKQAKDEGKEIGKEAAEELLNICGNGLRKLYSEIDKLVTYVGDRKKIEREDVLALASPGMVSTFALTDALSAKDLKQALMTFGVLYKNKVQIFPLLSLLASQFRTMLQVKKMENAAKAASVLKMSPYFVRKCMEKSVKFSEEELARNLRLLLETSLKIKNGEAPQSTLELLFASLCES